MSKRGTRTRRIGGYGLSFDKERKIGDRRKNFFRRTRRITISIKGRQRGRRRRIKRGIGTRRNREDMV